MVGRDSLIIYRRRDDSAHLVRELRHQTELSNQANPRLPMEAVMAGKLHKTCLRRFVFVERRSVLWPTPSSQHVNKDALQSSSMF
jgi:hypothetical protein